MKNFFITGAAGFIGSHVCEYISKNFPKSNIIALDKLTYAGNKIFLKDLIKLNVIIFKKDENDTRVKHVFLTEYGIKIFNEIFSIQKKRVYKAFLNSKSEEVISFDNVLKKIINGKL